MILEQFNFYLLLLVAFIPLLVGYVWYHPKVFGQKLARDLNQSSSGIGTVNSVRKVIWMYLLGVLLTYIIGLLSVHQISPYLLFFGEPQMADPNFGAHTFLSDFITQYGDRHRTIGHGILHGTESGLFISLALIGGTALIEGKPMKKNWIHIGFWTLSTALMGGILGAYL